MRALTQGPAAITSWAGGRGAAQLGELPVDLLLPTQVSLGGFKTWREEGDGASVLAAALVAGAQLGRGSALQDDPRTDRSAPVPEEMPHDPVPALLGAGEEACRMREGVAATRRLAACLNCV